MSRCIVVLKKILEQESKGWYIKYKDRLITELKGVKLMCVIHFYGLNKYAGRNVIFCPFKITNFLQKFVKIVKFHPNL